MIISLSRSIIVVFLLLGFSAMAQVKPAEIGSDGCPLPTKYVALGICNAIHNKSANTGKVETDISTKYVSYGYQAELWKAACADPAKDNFEEAKKKIQTWWMKNREECRCYNFPTSLATDRNIMKFSFDTGFTTLLVEAVKRFDLDMNFIDPADHMTILDFMKQREAEVRVLAPVDYEKADEYLRLIKLLRDHGAKYGSELKVQK